MGDLGTFPAVGDLLWAIAIIPIAAYLHGLLGMGFVTILMPILVLVLDFRLIMVLTVPPALILSAQLTFFGGNLKASIGRFWYLPVFVVLLGVFLAVVKIPLDFPIPYGVDPMEVREIIWSVRQLDLFGQVVILLLGVFGVVLLFKDEVRKKDGI